MGCSHGEGLTRRNFCLCLAGSAATATLLPAIKARAQAPSVVDAIRASGATEPVKSYALRGRFSALVGSGGNIAVLAGPEGKLLVDAGVAASRPRIVSALARLGRGPVTHLINTHWHFDHADGNAWLNEQGAAIVAHTNTRKYLSKATRVDDWNFDFPPSPVSALPTQLVDRELTLNVYGESLRLTHPGPAHTDGDLIVHFEDSDIVHGGDIYWRSYPFIDYSTGGSIDGTIQATKRMLAVSGRRTIIIPGHGGPHCNRAELERYLNMLSVVRERIAGLKRAGRTIEEVLAAKPTSQFDEAWGRSIVAPLNFIKLVYSGV